MAMLQTEALTATGATTAIPTQGGTFTTGTKVIAYLTSPTGTFSGNVIIQTKNKADASWSTATGATAATTAGTYIQEITTEQEVRLSGTVSSGSKQLTLVNFVS